MSEATPEGGNDSGQTPAADEFQPITSQEELNAALKPRLERERAKFSDYKDLKAAKDELDQIKAANQTEAEKAQSRIAELETEMQSVRLEALRRKVAGEHQITDQDDIDLFLTGTDEETLTRQAKRLADREADRKKNGNRVPNEGRTPSSADNPDRAFVGELFGE